MRSTEWFVGEYQRTHAQHGTFFVAVYSTGHVRASRVWDAGTHLECETLYGAGAFLGSVGDDFLGSVEEAKAACERRIAQLDQLASVQPMDAVAL